MNASSIQPPVERNSTARFEGTLSMFKKAATLTNNVVSADQCRCQLIVTYVSDRGSKSMNDLAPSEPNSCALVNN